MGIPMIVFFQCVANAVIEKGIRGLAEMVPGGGYAYEVAEDAWKKYGERRREQKLHEDVAKMAQASFEEIQKEARAVIQEVNLASYRKGTPRPTVEEIIDLELYLTAIPGAVRSVSASPWRVPAACRP